MSTHLQVRLVLVGQLLELNHLIPHVAHDGMVDNVLVVYRDGMEDSGLEKVWWRRLLEVTVAVLVAVVVQELLA